MKMNLKINEILTQANPAFSLPSIKKFRLLKSFNLPLFQLLFWNFVCLFRDVNINEKFWKVHQIFDLSLAFQCKKPRDSRRSRRLGAFFMVHPLFLAHFLCVSVRQRTLELEELHTTGAKSSWHSFATPCLECWLTVSRVGCDLKHAKNPCKIKNN